LSGKTESQSAFVDPVSSSDSQTVIDGSKSPIYDSIYDSYRKSKETRSYGSKSGFSQSRWRRRSMLHSPSAVARRRPTTIT